MLICALFRRIWLLYGAGALLWNAAAATGQVVAEAPLSQLFLREPLAHTFSVVARDSASGEMGVAVQSHWFSVGTVVSWAEAGVGVVATQSFVNKSFGPRGLALMRSGLSAREALDSLLKNDPGRAVRQVALLDAQGRVAVHTGEGCIAYACDAAGAQYSVQANMMLGPDVCSAMQQAWETSQGKSLAERLLCVLEAAQAAGGDFRGQQSAALLVVRGQRTNTPWDDRLIDLRVDDHPTPVAELRRLYTVHLAYEHMNRGDYYMEKGDMRSAMREYSEARRLLPQQVELQFWTALTLANVGQMDAALPIFADVFHQAPIWKIALPRLRAAGIITVSAADMERILRQ
ncbi:MAG: DUF1028 domain-containing protein [Saprospiraceae bacterium]|nr:DUF1028 domain-containing protein [Saprospiraceae bacterium]MDW8229971.1 DUF1028 domain-containing protein [Saprospiraceae bacterium]